MNEDTVASRITVLLVDSLGIEPDVITPTAELAEDLGIDSVDSVQLTIALEREFGMSFPDAALADVRTVQDVIDLVCAQSGAPSAVAHG
jgi:acyl carrier protein